MNHFANTLPIDQPLPSLAFELGDGFTDVFGSSRGSGETDSERSEREQRFEREALLKEPLGALAVALEDATTNRMSACIERVQTAAIDEPGYWELHDATIKAVFKSRVNAYNAPLIWADYAFKFDAERTRESVPQLHHPKADYFRNLLMERTMGKLPDNLLDFTSHVDAIYKKFVVDGITRRVCIMSEDELTNLLGEENIARLEVYCGVGNAHRGMNVHFVAPIVSKWFDTNAWQKRPITQVTSPAETLFQHILSEYVIR